MSDCEDSSRQSGLRSILRAPRPRIADLSTVHAESGECTSVAVSEVLLPVKIKKRRISWSPETKDNGTDIDTEDSDAGSPDRPRTPRLKRAASRQTGKGRVRGSRKKKTDVEVADGSAATLPETQPTFDDLVYSGAIASLPHESRVLAQGVVQV